MHSAIGAVARTMMTVISQKNERIQNDTRLEIAGWQIAHHSTAYVIASATPIKQWPRI